MAFMRDVTIGEGESVPPNTTFLKTWKIQNNGKKLTACSRTSVSWNKKKKAKPP